MMQEYCAGLFVGFALGYLVRSAYVVLQYNKEIRRKQYEQSTDY